MNYLAYSTYTVTQKRRKLVKTCAPFTPRPTFPSGWNVRPLNETDFLNHCELDQIQLIRLQIDCAGLYLSCDGIPHIVLDTKLRGSFRLFVSMHELGHYLLHAPGEQFLPGRADAVEVEADAFAACAMVPKKMLEMHSLKEIAQQYRFSMPLLEYRAEIADRWGF